MDKLEVKEFKILMKFAPWLSKNFDIECWEEQQKDVIFDGTPVCWLLNHNAAASWMPVVPIIGLHLKDEAAKRSMSLYPYVIFHNDMNLIPIAKTISKKITGNNVGSFQEAVDILSDDKMNVVATCPEGMNCIYDFDSPVAEFQQLGLIKAALMSGSKIVVCTMRHRFPFSVNIPIPGISEVKEGAKGIRFPIVRRTDNKLRYRLWQPPFSKYEFNNMSEEEQTNALKEVSNMIRQVMIDDYTKIEFGE